MAVITISRQLGSLGDAVAQAVASRLGYAVVGRDLINQAARRAGTPEVALAVIDEFGLLGMTPSARDQRAYQKAVHQVLAEVAARDRVVIVGRAGCAVLADHPNCLHVRVVAPKAVRVARVADRMQIPQEAALAQVEHSDRSRAKYLRRHHRVDWEAAYLYDIAVNTARLPVAGAAALVCLALDQRMGLNDGDTPGAITPT